MSAPTTVDHIIRADYEHGFTTEILSETFPPGLDEDIVRQISARKGEPEFFTAWRLKAYRHWLTMTEPHWAAINYPALDFQALAYYSAPKNLSDGPKSLAEVDPVLLETYAKLGIPLEEQKVLAGVAVDAVFDSVSIATTFRKTLAEAGVTFCSISEAIREFPELVRQYLGSVVPYTDNFYAALNTAVFSDGTFVHIPPGVRCPMDLSTYFRINARNTGQFERTLIIAEAGAYVSYLEGCHPAGELILTPNGWRTIETLKPGELIYDQNGEQRLIRLTMARLHQGEMLTLALDLDLNLDHHAIRLTPEHPVWVMRQADAPVWIKAEDLQPGDYLLAPKAQFIQFNKSHLKLETATHFLIAIQAITRAPWNDLVFNLDVAETHSYLVHGFAVHNCTAPQRDENQLHAAVVELIALDDATIKYSTVQNWYPGDANGRGGIYNFVTKRGDCRGARAKISWTQIETGSAITWKYPSCLLRGEDSSGEFYSVAVTKGYQQADTGTKMIHLGKNTRSTIVSKGISAGHGRQTYRGLVRMGQRAEAARNHTQCDSLLIGDQCSANTLPSIEIKNPTAILEHEATTSKISADQLFYCQARGLNPEDAVALIVNGFCKIVLNELPMEFAVEAQKLLSITLENSIG